MSGSHSHGGNEHTPKAWKRTLASIFASIIVGIGTMIQSIFMSIFKFLESLA